MAWESPGKPWTEQDEAAFQAEHKQHQAEETERQRITALARGFVNEARQHAEAAEKRGQRGDDVIAKKLREGAQELEQNAQWPVHRVINTALWIGKYQNLRAHLAYQGKTVRLSD